MKHGVFFLVCFIFPLNVTCFEFIRDFLFPRTPTVNRVRNLVEAPDDDFAVLDTVGIGEQFGYSVEEHNITTLDEYNIIIFRIYESPTSPKKRDKPVILLQHGLYASSDIWVLPGPGKSLADKRINEMQPMIGLLKVIRFLNKIVVPIYFFLIPSILKSVVVFDNSIIQAFLLADRGYDVWIGNLRGNSYGRSHNYIPAESPEFWKFSYHEHAVRDLPSMIDYILEFTGKKTLSYVGHSMGTTVAFALLSEMPEYNEKISLYVSLAPVALWKEAPQPILQLSDPTTVRSIKNIFDQNGIHELLPQTTNNGRLARALCSDGLFTQVFCKILVSALAGYDPDQLNSTGLPRVFSYFPAGSSATVLYHYSQNINSGTFQKFDFGFVDNFRLYGKKKPPAYDLKKISAPVALIYGKNDIVAPESNVAELAKKLQNVVTFEAVPYEAFNHYDFLWAIDVKELLHDRVIELLEMYSK